MAQKTKVLEAFKEVRIPERHVKGIEFLNWEKIQEARSDSGRGYYFTALPLDFGEEMYKKESDKRKGDLQTADIAWHICDVAGSAEIGFDFEDIKFIEDSISHPFIDRRFIEQIHDSVEELSNRKKLLEQANKVHLQVHRMRELLRELYQKREISFLEFDKRNLETYAILGDSLDCSDSRILRGLSDILQSHLCKDSPMGAYYSIVNSGSVKVAVDNRGFQLFGQNDSINVDSSGMNFTCLPQMAVDCISNSIQRERAYHLAELSEKFLSHMMILASWANHCRLSKPEFNDRMSTIVKNGYHPLLKSKKRKDNGERIVCHDTKLDSKDKVLAVTGVNCGGKSTYIKELAVTSMLAQAGSFVPVEYANLPVYSRFLTHFRGEEDIFNNLSLFKSEVASLNSVLRRMDDKTLLVCDELFRGTESGKRGGERLHSAVVEALVKDYRGRTLLSSHYHDSLREQRNLPHISFRRVETDISGSPTYRIVNGVDKGGYAIRAAIAAGVDRKIVERLNGDGKF